MQNSANSHKKLVRLSNPELFFFTILFGKLCFHIKTIPRLYNVQLYVFLSRWSRQNYLLQEYNVIEQMIWDVKGHWYIYADIFRYLGSLLIHEIYNLTFYAQDAPN